MKSINIAETVIMGSVQIVSNYITGMDYITLRYFINRFLYWLILYLYNLWLRIWLWLLEILRLYFVHTERTDRLHSVPRLYTFGVKLIVIAFQPEFIEFLHRIKCHIFHCLLHLLTLIALFLRFLKYNFLRAALVLILFIKMLFVEWLLTNDTTFILLYDLLIITYALIFFNFNI